MIRIGWFSPISTQTGIAQYSRNVLQELHRLYPKDRIEVIVFHPATTDSVVALPYPVIELGDSLIGSDFSALFDVAVYHLGNNEKNHGPIYAAMRRHPGIVVLHDYVYQHYLASVSAQGGYVGASFGGLIQSAGGIEAFDFLADSGMLKSADGNMRFVPWDGQWGTQLPLCGILARLGTAAIVHSDFARTGLGETFAGPTLQLFMPRPDAPEVLRPISPPDSRIHIVCGGHIGSTKGLRLLTAAFAQAPALKALFRVTIAGFGSDPHFLKLLKEDIRSIGLRGVFDLCIDPDDAAFAAITATADVFYNLRYPNTEGASLSLVEQMAHHRAVIAYRSGCFAEVPEDACFFLDRIGDVAELAALLGDIAANRAALQTRGDKAWDVVCDQTAAKYAEAFVTFIETTLDRLQTRTELVSSRSQMKLPVPAPQDKVWLGDYIASKILLDEFYEHKLYLSDHFLTSSADAKSRYLVQNLLHTRVSAQNSKLIGRILDSKTPLALYELVGKLLRLAEQTVRDRELLGIPPETIGLQLQDPDFWHIVLRLPGSMAIPMARLALGIPHTAVSVLLESTEQHYIIAALRDYLEIHGDGLETRATLGSLIALLNEIEHAMLVPVANGVDLIALLRSKPAHAGLRMVGFHRVEPIGIWTAMQDATLLLRINAQTPAKALTLRMELLIAAETVTITVLEKQSGRTERLLVPFDAGQTTMTGAAHLPLPEFAGDLSVTVSIGAVRSPESLSLSTDKRELGVLVKSVMLI